VAARGARAALVRVAVDAPVPQALSYAAPSAQPQPEPGTRVLVPLGRRRVAGVVLGPHQGPPPKGLRTISEVLDEEPALPADVLALAEFAAIYYRAAPGEVLRSALPPGMGALPSPRLRLTERGQRLLAVALLADLDREERRLLEALGRGPRSRRALIGRGRGTAALARLIEQRLVVELAGRTTSPPTIARYYLTPQPGEAEVPTRAQRMQEVMAALGRRDGQSAAELEAAIPGARSALTRLQRRQLVERREEAAPTGALETLPETGALRPTLSAAQAQAVEAVGAAIDAAHFAPFLLFGVTSSGKTEVYLAAVERALALGRGALVLVPEIALTPQLVGRFERRLAAPIEVLHSGLAVAERRKRWARVRAGEARCVIGARSAVFAPVAELGIIVVDEEHETSYKQEEAPRYHARDLALYRAQTVGCPVLLGSATPSLESYQRARRGDLELLRLPERVGGANLPTVEVVPIRPGGAGLRPEGGDEIDVLTPELVAALEQTLARQEQAILFLNRRGFAHFVLCLDCGETVGCPNCSVTLTHHRREAALVCHYCGHRVAIPLNCGRCQGEQVVPIGVGTERLEAEVQRRFPTARVARLDRDTMRRRGALVRCLERFAAGEMDILVGTQMLAKGHDYPAVTLVGVVVADAALGLADFRAAERTFQLLAQVAGRAGRGSRPGRVVVQAFDPSHPAITAARTHDFEGFAARELAEREELAYPPFGRLAVVRVEATDAERAERAAEALVRRGAHQLPGSVRLLGPAPAPLARLRGVHRVQLLVKAPTVGDMQRALTALERAHGDQGVRLVFDVDPALVL